MDAHSDKQAAAGTDKGGFGCYPLVCYLDRGDGTGEALSGILRPGNAGSNTAQDHIEAIDLALAQLPKPARDQPLLVRADTGGATHAWLTTCASVACGSRSAGQPTNASAPRSSPCPQPPGSQPSSQRPAAPRRRGRRVSTLDLAGWPPGTRAICRREDPHPGAQLSFSDADGHRFQVFITDQPDPDLATLELRHRRRARVEDRIRCGKATGLRNLPFDLLRRNQVWPELVLGAQDLTCWAQTLLLDGDLKVAEPKTLRIGCGTWPPAWSATPAADRPPAAHLAMGGRAGRRVYPPPGPAAALLTATRRRAVPVGRPGLATMPAVSKPATRNRPRRQRPHRMGQPSGRWTANQPQLRPPPAPRTPHEKPRLRLPP